MVLTGAEKQRLKGVRGERNQERSEKRKGGASKTEPHKGSDNHADTLGSGGEKKKVPKGYVLGRKGYHRQEIGKRKGGTSDNCPALV